MKPVLHVVVAAALLAACESAPVWQKDGVSESVRKDDSDSCHTNARLKPTPYPNPPPSPYAATTALNADDARLRFEQEEFRHCMQDKGYSARR